MWDKSERSDGTFGRSAFTFDAEHDRYVCPAGKYLKTIWRHKQTNPFRYRASLYDCQACALKSKCCPNVDKRKIERAPTLRFKNDFFNSIGRIPPAARLVQCAR